MNRQVDVNTLIAEYKKLVGDLQHELLMSNAIIAQLEGELVQKNEEVPIETAE